MKTTDWFSGWPSINKQGRSRSRLLVGQYWDLAKADHSSTGGATKTKCETDREDIACGRMGGARRFPGLSEPAPGRSSFISRSAGSISQLHKVGSSRLVLLRRYQ